MTRRANQQQSSVKAGELPTQLSSRRGETGQDKLAVLTQKSCVHLVMARADEAP